jgi:hypothetical protein
MPAVAAQSDGCGVVLAVAVLGRQSAVRRSRRAG